MGTNVRAFEPITARQRGGSRSGLSRYINAQVNGSNLIQNLDLLITTTGGGSGTSQTTLSTRTVIMLAISNGTVKVANAGDTSWTAVTNGSAAFNNSSTSPQIFSAQNSSPAAPMFMYFADGTNYKKYNPTTNSILAWTASSGSLPVNGSNKPRLICTWRGRTVLSGIIGDPQNWFMSKSGDPTNFNYSPASISPVQAVAGNNSNAGLIGDVITTMIPYTDDVLIFGGDHTIWMMHGDPMNGGQIDQVTQSVGMAWGRPWCIAPDGTIYFFSNRTGIYAMVPGQKPVRISQNIEPLIQNTDTGLNSIRMIWDDRQQGFHTFITPTAAAAATTHLFWESRTNAWWQDTFGNNNHNPVCCVTFDGNLPTDRRALIGSWDGYVRAIDPTATQDDGTNISSNVLLGPLMSPYDDDVMMKEIQATLATGSGNVNYAVYTGASAEAASTATAAVTGTFTNSNSGRNNTVPVRRAAHAIYLDLNGTTQWGMERVRVKVTPMLGKVRQRGR